MSRRREWGKITRKGKRFYADYLGPDQKRHTPGFSFPTRGEAEGWLAAERRLIDLDTWQPPAVRRQRADTDGVTVGEWMDRFHNILENGTTPLKPSTMQNYRRVTRLRITGTTFADLPLTTVRTGDVYRWWDEVQRDYPNAKTINQQAYKRLRAGFAEAVRRQMIESNPVDIPDAKKRVTPKEKYLPSDTELEKILDAMPVRYKALASMVLHHGLRIGEALAVRLEDVQVEDGPVPYLPPVTIKVRHNVQRITDGDGTYMLLQSPKTRAGVRDVPVMACDTPIFLRHLTTHDGAVVVVRTERGSAEMRPFTTTGAGRIMFDTSFRSVLERAEIRAGVTTEIDPHCGRNWLITRLAEQGAHLKEIGALLGQEDVTTILDVYMKVRAGRTTDLMGRVSASIGQA